MPRKLSLTQRTCYNYSLDAWRKLALERLATKKGEAANKLLDKALDAMYPEIRQAAAAAGKLTGPE